MAVAYVAIQEFKTDGGTSITMTAPVGTAVGDLLIAYISKDDNVAIYNTGSYGDWNMVFNNIANGQTCLYIAWKWAEAGDAAETKTQYTWNGDSEDWLGEILCYSGVKAVTPIHGTPGISTGGSATPTAPSVAFNNLAAGSLVLQVMGIDQDDNNYITPAQLIERFNAIQAADIGGAGGDREASNDMAAWDVSAAIYDNKSKLVNDQDIIPYNVTFSSDGSKMYFMGAMNDTVYQYTLSTAWDVSTAVYADKYKLVSAQDTFPCGVTFSSNGTKMYMVGSGNDTIYQYTLSTAWDVSTAVYADKYKLVSAQDTFPLGVTFSPDGSKMYMVGSENDTVYQYTLSTPWDVDTATYAEKLKDVGAQDTFPRVTFSPDGNKMYVMGTDNDTVYQYTLSTAWDVSTAVYAEKSKLVSAQETYPCGVTFSPDGTKMYIVGTDNDTVYQYTLNSTGTAIFTATSRPWAAATVIIEAAVAAGDYEYTGSGSFAYSGVATQTYTRIYLTTASGQFAYSGSATQVYSKNYLFEGSGSLAFSGSAVIIVGLAYVGSGLLTYSGEAVVTYTRDFLSTAVGELIYSGEAIFSYLCDFLFTGSGELAYSGSATQSYTSKYSYTGTGSFHYSGVGSYELGLSYTGSGSLAYSGIAVQSYTTDFVYDTSGSFVFSGVGIYSIGFAFTGGGSLTYSGESTQTYTFNYFCVGSGEFVYSGSAVQIHTRYYLYEGSGELTYSGTAVTAIGFAYISSGEFIYSGAAECSYEIGADFEYVGSGTLAFSGTATQVYTRGFLYTGSGNFIYSGSATKIHTKNFLYSASGQLLYSGTALYSPGFSYIGDGTFVYSGTATQVRSHNYLYAGSGEFIYSGIAKCIYETEAVFYVYVGSGSLNYSGEAVYSYTFNYPYYIFVSIKENDSIILIDQNKSSLRIKENDPILSIAQNESLLSIDTNKIILSIEE